MGSIKVAFYKGTRPGLAGIYSYAVRGWTRSPYSHVEAIFSDGMAASSSFTDGGVRFKRIAFDPNNWDFLEIECDEATVRQWFSLREGKAYDLTGNLSFIIGFIPDGKDKWSCAESVAAALGLPDAWRYSPAILYSVLSSKTSKQSTGI